MKVIITNVKSKRVVKIASRLIRADSQNPPGDERKVAKVIESILKENHLNYEKIVYGKTRVNFVITVGEGKKKLLWLTHSDTVPIGSGWTHDSLGGTVERGRLYGRGAGDNKGHVAAAIEAMINVRDKIDGQIVLVIAADEETGGKFGLHALLKDGKIEADAGIVVDASEYVIDVAEKGPLSLELVARGKAAHGAYPEKGDNAILKMTAAIERIRKLKIGGKHKLLGKPTINIGTIEGGTKTNMVPDICRATLDVRILPGQSEREVISKIKKVAEDVKVKKIMSIKPCEVDRNSEIVRALISATKAITKTAKVKGVAGCTCLSLLPFPAVATGFGTDNAHKVNEYISVKDLKNGVKILENTAISYLNSKKIT